MTKFMLPRRDFLTIAGATLATSAFPMVRAFGAEPIRFGFQNSSWGSIGMIADAADTFKKAGADVKIFRFDSGKTTRDAMISGRVDVGVIGATPFVIGAAKGQMQAIGLALYGAKTLAVVASLKSGVNSIKGLKGKRVGSQFGSATDHVFKSKILPKAGLSEKDVQMVNVRFQNHVSALAAGSIDAFAGVEPFVTVCEVNKLGKSLTDYTPYDLEPVILAANTDVINKNRQGVIEFLRGYLAAVKIFDNQRAEATKIVLEAFTKKGFKVDENIIKVMLSKIDVNPDFKPELKDYLTNQSKVLIKQKRISAVPDWNKLLNQGLLNAARAKS
jgi:ABC-type nitrate/sulfonate/bicarbonate transport system substrate-binding protein